MHRSKSGSKLAFCTAAGVMLMASTQPPALSAPLTGEWGGPQVRFKLTETGGQLDLACASATIEAPVRIDAAGTFTVVGQYEDFTGGPTPADTPPHRITAQFSGHVNGNMMQLSVRHKGSEAGQYFQLEQGRRVKLIRCM